MVALLSFPYRTPAVTLLLASTRPADILGMSMSKRDARQCMRPPALRDNGSGGYLVAVIRRTTSCMRARYKSWLGSMRDATSSSPRASSYRLRAIRQAANE